LKGTKVDRAQGVIGPCDYRVPESLFSYLNEQAKAIRVRMTDVSSLQRKKMDDTLRVNVDRYSDEFRAMNADVTMFGMARSSHQKVAVVDKASERIGDPAP